MVDDFRDFHIAASLKQTITVTRVFQNFSFPRLPYRGLIEAVLCIEKRRNKWDFRDFHIAASLKPATT